MGICISSPSSDKTMVSTTLTYGFKEDSEEEGNFRVLRFKYGLLLLRILW